MLRRRPLTHLPHPIRIQHRVARRTPQVRIRRNHAPQQLLDPFTHLPRPHPLAAERARPVLLEVALGGELLAVGVLEGRAADEDLEEGHAEGPDVRLARVVREAAGAFGGEVLCVRCELWC